MRTTLSARGNDPTCTVAAARYTTVDLLRVFLLLIETSALLPQPIQLSTRPQNINATIVYPGQSIVFICTTVGSPIQAWSSDNYIGLGGVQLEFLSIDRPGTIHRVNEETYANLTRVNQQTHELVSEFHIVVSSGFSSVICYASGLSLSDVISFNVSDVPAQEVTTSFDDGRVCHGQKVQLFCITRGSPILAWKSDEYIGEGGVLLEFLLIDDSGTIKTTDFNDETVAQLNQTFETDGVHMIFSYINITVLPDIDEDGHNITCINVGIGTKQVTTIRLADNCGSTTTVSGHDSLTQNMTVGYEVTTVMQYYTVGNPGDTDTHDGLDVVTVASIVVGGVVAGALTLFLIVTVRILVTVYKSTKKPTMV